MAHTILECALISQLHRKENEAENAGHHVVSSTLTTMRKVKGFARNYDCTYFKKSVGSNGMNTYHVVGVNYNNEEA